MDYEFLVNSNEYIILFEDQQKRQEDYKRVFKKCLIFIVNDYSVG